MSVYSCPGAGPDACQSTTISPSGCCLICPINLTTVTIPATARGPVPGRGRRAHADGAGAPRSTASGPAILPLDPALPAGQAGRAAQARSRPPPCNHRGHGTARAAAASPARQASSGRARDDTAVVHRHLGLDRRAQGRRAHRRGADRLGPRSLRLGVRRPARAERWLCCLPTFHIAGLGVLVRSLMAGTEPVVADRVDPAVLAGSGCAHVSLVPTQLRRLLDAGAPLGRSARSCSAAPRSRRRAAGRGAAAGGWRVVTTYGMSETCGGCVYDGVPLDGYVRLDAGPDGPDRDRRAGAVLRVPAASRS